MSVDHVAHYTAVVKAALKQAAMGEPFGYAVANSTVPAMAQGQPVGIVPGWIITVSVRDGLSPDPIAEPRAIPHPLPPDKAMEDAARQALEACRAERDKRNTSAVAQAGMEAFVKQGKAA